MKLVHILRISADLSFRATPTPNSISNLPEFECVGTAYELAGTSLYDISLGRGLINLLKGLVNTLTGLAAPQINAIGYHPVQNYIYGISYLVSPQAIVRIGAGGAFEFVQNAVIPTTVTTQQLLIGDIDTNEQYWLGYASGAGYVQVDMDVTSDNYTKVVDSGVTINGKYAVGDWAYIPAYQNRLWSLGQEIISNVAGIVTQYNTHLVYLDLNTKTWVDVFTFENVNGGLLGTPLLGQALWGAVYSANDGFIYATESTTGNTWKFPLAPVPGSVATLVSLVGTLPLLGQQIDGARCALNDDLYSQ